MQAEKLPNLKRYILILYNYTDYNMHQ